MNRNEGGVDGGGQREDVGRDLEERKEGKQQSDCKISK